MMKMHLGAVVPNEGARRLAAWTLTKASASIEAVAAAAGIEATTVDRILTGDVIPAGDMAHRLWLATDGTIDRRDWRTEAHGWWFDAIPSRRVH